MVKISKSMFQGFFRAKSYPACQFDLTHQHVFLIFKFLPLSLSKKWAKNVLFTWSDLYLKGTGLKYQLWPETAKQGLPFVNQAQDNTLWISILLTHSLKHKVQIIKSCSFKMIFFLLFSGSNCKALYILILKFYRDSEKGSWIFTLLPTNQVFQDSRNDLISAQKQILEKKCRK